MEHTDIPDGKRHEPKGAGSAVANTYLKANGDGSTAFSLLTVDSISDVDRMPVQAAIADPSSASAEDVANALNSLLEKLKTAGLMARS